MYAQRGLLHRGFLYLLHEGYLLLISHRIEEIDLAVEGLVQRSDPTHKRGNAYPRGDPHLARAATTIVEPAVRSGNYGRYARLQCVVQSARLIAGGTNRQLQATGGRTAGHRERVWTPAIAPEV